MVTLTTLVSFNFADGNFPDGAYPYSGLIADAAGNLFGTLNNFGANDCGTVFEIAKTSTGYASTPTVLVSLNGTNAGPLGRLIADGAGDLFGTSEGSVFEIAKTSTGYASTPTTLVSFDGTNGYNLYAGLIIDDAGDLFGTTAYRGANGRPNSAGNGTVFEIPYIDGSYANTPTTLVNFNRTNGAAPYGGLIADAAGDLFGTTTGGGASGNGTVFEIAKTSTGYASTPTVLVNFNGTTNGGAPEASLIADGAGTPRKASCAANSPFRSTTGQARSWRTSASPCRRRPRRGFTSPTASIPTR